MEKTQKAMIQEIWQGVYGVPNTDDKGMCGDIKLMLKKNGEQDKRITKIEVFVATLSGLLVGTGILESFNIINIF